MIPRDESPCTAQGEPMVVNEATDGAGDPRELWTDEQVAEYNDRWDGAVKTGRIAEE
jgi:hypothetical protein